MIYLNSLALVGAIAGFSVTFMIIGLAIAEYLNEKKEHKNERI